jgi:outer membrane receptor protein involved in Fe transport
MQKTVTALVVAVGIALCSTQTAWAQIAPGVLQSAAHTATVTGTVTLANGQPVSGADVRLRGQAVLSAKTDNAGAFIFRSVPWGTYQIVVSSTFGTAERDNVILNADVNVAIQFPAGTGLRTIARVSTTNTGAHINVTSSAIQSVSPSRFAFEGNGTWAHLFDDVPGVTPSGYTNGATYAWTAFSPNAPAVLTLNGALPYETATLLDGMPLQGTSATLLGAGGGVDLSVLPINGFDTADVVRGPGANAPSIVDSIGGSFVLHPPGTVARNSFELSVSNDPYGGIVSNADVAVHFGRLSATFAYGTNDSPGPLGHRNELGALFTPLAINGQSVWSPTFTEPNPSDGIVNCRCTGLTSLLYCCVPQSTAWSAQHGAASLSYAITPSITAEVFYAGSTSNQNYQFGYFPTEFAPSGTAPPYTGSFTPSPPGQKNYSILGVLSPGGELYPQASSLLEEKVTAYLGSGVVRLGALQYNSFAHSNYLDGLQSGEYNVWGTANVGAGPPGTPTAYNGGLENLTFFDLFLNEYSWTNNRDLLGSYAAQLGPDSTGGISFVTSYYNEPYFENLLYHGSPLFALNQSTADSDTTNELRLYFESAIGKLSLGASWYFANSSFHLPSTANPNQWTNSQFPYSAPRLGLVWQASPNVAIRAAAGGGYALPSINDILGAPLSFLGTYYVQSAANPNLKPEESFGVDVGTDFRINRDTVVSFDAYRTNLFGQFYTTLTQSTFNGLPLYLYEFSNLAASRMEGINLTAQRDVPVGYYWKGSLGFTRGYVVSVPQGFYNGIGCVKCANTAIVPGANFNNVSGYLVTVPYADGSATFGYRWRPGTFADLAATYYGNNNAYFTPRAFVALNAHAGFSLGKNLSLLVTFYNITNAYGQSVQTFDPSYAVPVIQGGAPNPVGAAFAIPYGPRSVLVTLGWRSVAAERH